MPERSIPKDTGQEIPGKGRTDAPDLYELILDAASVATFTTNSSGVLTSINRTATSLLGYVAEEVIGTATPALFHDLDEIRKIIKWPAPGPADDPQTLFNLLAARALQQKTPDRSEWTFVRKDGSRFRGSLTLVAVRDDEGNVAALAGVIADLSTQHRLKEEVQISDEKFRLLAENIPGTIYLCNNDEVYSVIYVNDNIFTLTGIAASDFYSGKTHYGDLIHPSDKNTVARTINACLDQRTNYHLRYRLRHASGQWRWVEESGVGLFDGDKLMMLEGYIQDVTQQKEGEDRLRHMANENLRFFNNPVNLNTVTDFAGNMIRISPSWTKVLGWSEDELTSQPLFNIIHPDDLSRAKEELEFIATTSSVHTFENRLICKDGSFRWLLWALAPDPVMQVVYASAIDITERRKSEEHILDSKSNLENITLQLQEQNRKLDEFAHIISHNLRAPLNNIQALINLLDEKSDINDYKLIFDKLKNVSKNLGETMNELMDTLKAKTQPDVHLTEIRFKEVLDKVVQSLEGELIVAQASVTFDFNEAPILRYSKPYLESIFQNLLTNAVKYRSSARKPTIHFHSRNKEGHVELEVTDNGQGIDMEKFGDKLFGLHKTFHEHQEARGVGLFLVKSQIEALGGTIRVESEVDKGTKFTIRFN